MKQSLGTDSFCKAYLSDILKVFNRLSVIHLWFRKKTGIVESGKLLQNADGSGCQKGVGASGHMHLDVNKIL